MCRTTSNVSQVHSALYNSKLQILETTVQYSSAINCKKFTRKKHVSFRDAIVSEVFERPMTLYADIPSFYYTQNDYRRFRYEFAAFKRALRIKKRRLSGLSHQQNIVCQNRKVENENGLLDSVISFFFDEQKLLSTSSCADTQNHMSQSNDMVLKSGLNSVNNWITTSSDMQHVWDLDLI
mmetsp:Transcript_2967/g.3494  ORF Transcript_2967/g.3494 Transcript_2967/m.3494 type:complete len:180 (-) Transcript_2967:737-1276(-)